MKKENLNETGRSMVEMLGVLAIVGVLSVAGIAGYTTAMKKYRANELLNEASKRAVMIAVQKAQGRSGDQLSLNEFGDATVQGATLGVTDEGLTKQFAITISSVDADVCKQIVSSVGSSNQVRVIKSESTDVTGNPDGCTTATMQLIYNDDLSPVDAQPIKPSCTSSNCVDNSDNCAAFCTTYMPNWSDCTSVSDTSQTVNSDYDPNVACWPQENKSPSELSTTEGYVNDDGKCECVYS